MTYWTNTVISTSFMSSRQSITLITVPFTVFYGLIEAIPNVWKDKIKRQNQNGKVDQNDNTTFNTNSIYSFVLKSSFVPPTSQNRILHPDFTENNVHKVYQLPFTITKEVKVIMFQYKVIHNIHPTQISLYRDGFSDGDMCPLCHFGFSDSGMSPLCHLE